MLYSELKNHNELKRTRQGSRGKNSQSSRNPKKHSYGMFTIRENKYVLRQDLKAKIEGVCLI